MIDTGGKKLFLSGICVKYTIKIRDFKYQIY